MSMPEQSFSESEISPKIKTEFDAGFVTISHLSSDPRGFTIEPGESLHRRDHTNSGLALSEEQRAKLRAGMASEVGFILPRDLPEDKKELVQQYFSTIDMLSKLKTAGARRDEDKEYTALLARQQLLQAEVRPILHELNLTERLGLKIGIRNIKQDRNTLTIDTRPISFPLYNVAAGPENSSETLDLSAITGTAAILMTADNKIILQHRSGKNSPYGDMPGASIAGMLDGKMRERTDGSENIGILEPLTTQTVAQSSLTEADQEIGIKETDLSELRIVGTARDHVQEHDAFLLLAKTELTSKEVAEKATNAPRSRTARKLDEHGDFHFEENFITIDATPEAIETLLTQVKCPLPPTHAAAFVAAGYSMLMEQKGLEAAKQWMDRLQIGIKKNYQEMNEIVTQYYKDFPSELGNNKPKKPTRNPNGYQPYYTPQEQGLPPLDPELLRTGLLR